MKSKEECLPPGGMMRKKKKNWKKKLVRSNDRTSLMVINIESASSEERSMVNGEGRFQEFPVQSGDVANSDTLGAYSLAFTMVSAVAEAILIHLHNH
jgi:hypothetical protein